MGMSYPYPHGILPQSGMSQIPDGISFQSQQFLLQKLEFPDLLNNSHHLQRQDNLQMKDMASDSTCKLSEA